MHELPTQQSAKRHPMPKRDDQDVQWGRLVGIGLDELVEQGAIVAHCLTKVLGRVVALQPRQDGNGRLLLAVHDHHRARAALTTYGRGRYVQHAVTLATSPMLTWEVDEIDAAVPIVTATMIGR